MKKIFFTILIIVLVGGSIYLYFRQPQQLDIEVFTEEEIEKEAEANIAAQQEIENTREEVMLAVAGEMNELSPYETIGQWFPVMFWFDRNDTNSRYFYVDFEDGHYMYRILLETLEVDNTTEFSTIGKFELGEEEWELKEGEDYLSGKIFDIYEWNPDTNKAKKN